jgi:hypothetical protein
MTDPTAPTPAHDQRETFTVIQSFPEHLPRESDPHYHYFHQAVQRLKAAGKYRCWINNADCAGDLEAHHSTVEFALANNVDISHFTQLYPEFGLTDDESFFRFVEEEGNLTILCRMHHIGVLGIHSIHYPAWLAQRFLKAGIAAPERKTSG